MRRLLLMALWLLVQGVAGADAQTPPAEAPARPAAERELTVIGLPTTQPLAARAFAFRLAHRFTRDLGFGDVGDLAADFFGLDAGAIIGLEFRFAPTNRFHVALHRSNLFKELQIFGRVDAMRQSAAAPIGLSLVGSISGDNNLQDHHQPAIGAVLSRSIGGPALVVYATPMGVWNTPVELTGHEGHDHEHDFEGPSPVAAEEDYTVFAGLAARLRLRSSVFLAAEYSPRVAGHAPGTGAWGVGIEKYTRGHMFQINVSNSFATTYAQIARGGNPGQVYLGFNLARRF